MNRDPVLSLIHEVGSGIGVHAGEQHLLGHRHRPAEAADPVLAGLR